MRKVRSGADLVNVTIAGSLSSQVPLAHEGAEIEVNRRRMVASVLDRLS